MKAYVLLAEGFEITEALATIDVLRRGSIDTVSVSINPSRQVTSSNGISVTADVLFDGSDLLDADALVLPGGLPGTHNLRDHQGVRQLVTRYDSDRKIIAAICAAPTVFASLGLLKGKNAVCYPGMENLLTDAIVSEQDVVRDGNIITAKGMGVSCLFGLAIVAALTDEENANKVAQTAIINC